MKKTILSWSDFSWNYNNEENTGKNRSINSFLLWKITISLQPFLENAKEETAFNCQRTWGMHILRRAGHEINCIVLLHTPKAKEWLKSLWNNRGEIRENKGTKICDQREILSRNLLTYWDFCWYKKCD